jgi:hypothetical protein
VVGFVPRVKNEITRVVALDLKLGPLEVPVDRPQLAGPSGDVPDAAQKIDDAMLGLFALLA